MKRLVFIIPNFGLLGVLLTILSIPAQELRSRQDGLHTSFSSSTAGKDNFHLAIFGRTFLWDNYAAQKIPPAMPHLALNYGFTEYTDLAIGINAVSYVFQPGYGYMRFKVTPFANKTLRLLGIAAVFEARRQFTNFFPSNGYRVKNEGFGPEGFIFGSPALVTSMRALMAMDIELIKLSSYLPFKLYLNLGWEGAYASHIEDDNRERAEPTGRPAPDQSFVKIPGSVGVEFKTFGTDFFIEVEAEPFLSNLLALGRNSQGWARYNIVGKTLDISIWETPLFLNTGGKMKYPNGLQLQGGLAWMLSQEIGSTLGPCVAGINNCREGATDGFSPFYPQWKIFGLISYPIRFHQPSSELYRSFLLGRFQDKSKKLDVEKTLGQQNSQELDELERQRRIEERRKKADAEAVDLN